ncbi:hypothetical protein [Jiulongibacter sediminis]|uniref:hypothetical protein n=1 Tax=Jiulongibacter sediminis TaxID=1605367 RepID=UPI0006DC2D47|nr:hypothetical protein [Jiulongibacter sediminis]
MKKLFFALIGLFLTTSTVSVAQIQNIDSMLDKVISLQKSGDNKALGDALGVLSKGLETEANETGGDFKAGLLNQVSGLNKMIPLASRGMVKAGPLQKIISTIKLMLGANRVGNLLNGGGSLMGKASLLKSGLGMMKGGSSILGDNANQFSSLIDGAMGNVNKLGGGGIAAKAAEKALPGQLGGILNMAKGIL